MLLDYGMYRSNFSEIGILHTINERTIVHQVRNGEKFSEIIVLRIIKIPPEESEITFVLIGCFHPHHLSAQLCAH